MEDLVQDPISGKLIPAHKARSIERARQAAIRRYEAGQQAKVLSCLDRWEARLKVAGSVDLEC